MENNNLIMNKISDSQIIEKYLEFYNKQFKPKSIIEMVEDLEDFAHRLSKNANFYVLKDSENHELGFMAFYANDIKSHIGFLSLIAVNEPFRGKGFGKILMDTFINICKQNGMDKLRLEVYKENTEALNLYVKYGYNFEKENADSYHMTRPIALINEKEYEEDKNRKF